MDLVCVGLSHRTAPVEQREKASLTDASARTLLGHLREAGLSEAVALSTCNRTEIYAVGHDVAGAEAAISGAFIAHTCISPTELACARYVHRAERAAAHLFRVAASLDSMVVGESEIQGQVRTAWERATEERAAGPILNHLFRQAVEVGKRVRTETEIGAGAASVSAMAVDLAQGDLGDVHGRRALVVGAGQMAEATIRSLIDHGLGEVVIANRTVSTAREVAARLGGVGVGFDSLGEELAAADIVISSTDAPHIVLRADDVARAMAGRAGRTMVVIDIAVPRDVDPLVGATPGVVLHNIDHLERLVEISRNGRAAAAAKAESIVGDEASRFLEWRRELAVVPTIRGLREHAEAIRAAELASMDAQWESLTDADRERIEQLTKTIVNRLLHEPTVRARAAAANGQGLRHVESLQHLFGLAAAESGAPRSTS